MLQQFLSGEPLPRPFYFPYLLIAYNAIYGFSDEITDLLNAALADAFISLCRRRPHTLHERDHST